MKTPQVPTLTGMTPLGVKPQAQIFHACNAKTGLIYSRVSAKFDHITTDAVVTGLTSEQLAVVRATFDNVISTDTEAGLAKFRLWHTLGLASWQAKTLTVYAADVRLLLTELANLAAVREGGAK